MGYGLWVEISYIMEFTKEDSRSGHNYDDIQYKNGGLFSLPSTQIDFAHYTNSTFNLQQLSSIVN